MLLSGILGRLIRIGTLKIIDAEGREHRFSGGEDGPSVSMRFHNRRIQRRFLTNASMALGEGYMDGSWTPEDCDLFDVLDLIGRNVEIAGHPGHQSFFRKLAYPVRRLQQYNPAHRSRKNVAHHYDLSGEMYDLFLDDDRQYSCAYYINEHDPLEIAQENKKRHIAAKLCLEPGQKVLDIGSGWGGLALYFAQEYGVEVTGLTLSTEQHTLAEKRAADAGLSDRVRFHLRDYRDQTGTFDRIVSVGMFEHVGINHYNQYFDKVRSLLTPEGVALIHTIGRMEPPGTTDPWIRKYIFPGGYLPALSEMVSAVEKCDLWVTDTETLRLHYAFTLRDWRQRFVANRDAAAQLYDERFCRMWEYYLAICEISFRYLRNTVFQVQMTREQETLPLTRQYLWNKEYRHASPVSDVSADPTDDEQEKKDGSQAA